MNLYDCGVNIYSAETLHAKVYAFQRQVFIGSANVSKNSAHTLNEAVLQTGDPGTVSEAKTFVRRLCQNELGPEALTRLKKLYKPPKIAGGKGRRRKKGPNSSRSVSPAFRIALLEDIAPPDQSVATRDKGEKAAEKRKRSKAHRLGSFWWTNRCPFQIDDTVLMIDELPSGKRMVNPPARVILRRAWNGNPRLTFVYVEFADANRISDAQFAKRLGYGMKKRLRRNGRVGDPKFIEAVWDFWNERTSAI